MKEELNNLQGDLDRKVQFYETLLSSTKNDKDNLIKTITDLK